MDAGCKDVSLEGNKSPRSLEKRTKTRRNIKLNGYMGYAVWSGNEKVYKELFPIQTRTRA